MAAPNVDPAMKTLKELYSNMGNGNLEDQMLYASRTMLPHLVKPLRLQMGITQQTSTPVTFLDNACGSGVLTEAVQQTLPKDVLEKSTFVCADAADGMVSVAKKRLDIGGWVNTEVKKLDATNTGLAAGSFTHVGLGLALHLIPKPDAVLADCKRILKPGGIFGATTFHKDNTFWLPDVRSAFESFPFHAPFPEVKMQMHDQGDWTNPAWIEEHLKEQGFQDVNVTVHSDKYLVKSAEEFVLQFGMMLGWLMKTWWSEEVRNEHGMDESPNTGAWLSINHVFAPKAQAHALAHAHPAIMIAPVTWAVVALGALTPFVAAAPEDGLPSYHYGASIPVECMSRNSETGEHIENEKHEIEWKPFPMCNETGRPLEFNYGTEGEVNCTIAMIDDPFFHLLEFYIHSDAPLSCRVPARPAAEIEVVGEKLPAREYVPLVFALAGTLQLSHIHISTHMNVLLHSTPKHHSHPHDSGVLDSAIAYSTSPLHHIQGSHTRKLVIGDPLPLALSVRWFPTPALPKTEGKVEWQGLGGHIYASTVFYSLVSFGAGVLVAAMYTLGVVLPKRLKGRALGGATPLGYGVNTVGNGWGYSKPNKRTD
ncbi:Ff.00g081020.m01.CDS01 [Fusarium sp. VM40]|nr:Ff.00g081020.m01.CDS01 [Fusarium sp. VM40]